MDATTKGALIGAGATAVGSAIAWIGARAQAKAALRAMTLQVRAQRFEGLWQMRRAAYADLLNSAEALRIRIGTAYGLFQGWQDAGPPTVSTEHAAEAVRHLHEAHLDLMHKGTVLGLSVTVAESHRADGFVSVFTGVVRDLDRWLEAIRVGAPDAGEAHRRLTDHMSGLRALIDHFIDDSRGYLQTLSDVAPEQRARFERLRRRLTAWRWAWVERRSGLG
ncbi:hypothetical protein [Streptomyces sp. FIT100]|uniref:hypothetical protein n=1 Tax=Streptomyces sp. FIT100 TaxID=2837956 RepID=UPI0021C7A1AE|nr:hypothetical protein [Streptomyces sp. FIT100]UUN27035.1 hypothetical protein KK483_11950 [Streptomyces sp. FIT100]